MSFAMDRTRHAQAGCRHKHCSARSGFHESSLWDVGRSEWWQSMRYHAVDACGHCSLKALESIWFGHGGGLTCSCNTSQTRSWIAKWLQNRILGWSGWRHRFGLTHARGRPCINAMDILVTLKGPTRLSIRQCSLPVSG